MWFMGHDCCAPIYLRGTRILHLQTVFDKRDYAVRPQQRPLKVQF